MDFQFVMAWVRKHTNVHVHALSSSVENVNGG